MPVETRGLSRIWSGTGYDDDRVYEQSSSGLNKPFFSPSSSAVIRAAVGSVAYLTCDNRFISMDKKEKMYNIITLAINKIKEEDRGS